MKAIKKVTLLFLICFCVSTLSLPITVSAATKLNKKSISLNVKNQFVLKLTKNGREVEFPEVTWKSSNKKIATVSSRGIVTGKKKGTCTIIAKYNNKRYKCKVKVKSGYNPRSFDVMLANTNSSRSCSLIYFSFTNNSSKSITLYPLADYKLGHFSSQYRKPFLLDADMLSDYGIASFLNSLTIEPGCTEHVAYAWYKSAYYNYQSHLKVSYKYNNIAYSFDVSPINADRFGRINYQYYS